jgi:hypothetical protein
MPVLPLDGCRNPDARNYNALAYGNDDYSCLYLFKHNGNCHLFRDMEPLDVIDKSFTLSYSPRENGSWVFFHDYIPDYYIHNRENLFTAKHNVIYKHNDGRPGEYYDTIKPFFIDIIFAGSSDMLLEDVNWVSEFLTNSTDQKFSTLTHISIWNGTQHTGRIPLAQVFEKLNYRNIRRTKGEWSFDSFKDVLQVNPGTFLGTLFNNFALDPTKVDTAMSWYQKKDIQDSWFCIRFEFDNSVDAKLILHDTTIHALKTDR